MGINNETVNKIIRALDLKKATDIQALYVGDITTITDYFVIATANSKLQAQAFCDHLEEVMLKDGIKHINKEGYNAAEWILLGYEDVVVHIFLGESREFYGLEYIWKDAVFLDISDLLIE